MLKELTSFLIGKSEIGHIQKISFFNLTNICSIILMYSKSQSTISSNIRIERESSTCVCWSKLLRILGMAV